MIIPFSHIPANSPMTVFMKNTLNLSGAKISILFLKKIEEWITEYKDINDINFSSCELTDNDIITLSSAFNNRLEKYFGPFDDIYPQVSLNLSNNPIGNDSVKKLLNDSEGLFKNVNLQNTQIDTFSLITYSLESDLSFEMRLPPLKFNSELLQKAITEYSELDLENNEEKRWRFICDVDSSVSSELLAQFKEFIKNYNGELIVENYTPTESTAALSNCAKRKRDLEEALQSHKKAKTSQLNSLLGNNAPSNQVLHKGLLRQSLDNKNSEVHFDSWNNCLAFNFPTNTFISSVESILLILEILKEKNATVASIEFNHCKFTSQAWDSLIKGLAAYSPPLKIKFSNMTLYKENIPALFRINTLTSLSFNNVEIEKDAELDFTDFLSECEKLKEFHFESRKFFALDSLFLALLQLKGLKILSLKRVSLHAEKEGIKSINFLYDLICRLPNLNKLAIERSDLTANEVGNLVKSIQLQKIKGKGVCELSLANSYFMTAKKLSPLFNTMFSLEILNLENLRKSNTNILDYLEEFRKSSCKELHLGNIDFSETLVNLLKNISKRKYTCTNPKKIVRISVKDKQCESFRRLQSYLAKHNIALIAEEIDSN
jgi:hypothetical protein